MSALHTTLSIDALYFHSARQALGNVLILREADRAPVPEVAKKHGVFLSADG